MRSTISDIFQQKLEIAYGHFAAVNMARAVAVGQE
jgi:hypothetical protein